MNVRVRFYGMVYDEVGTREWEMELGRDATVNDFMTQPAIHFEQNELLSDVCHCLMENAIRRVPVTSNGKVVGVISRSDILKCILRFSPESALAGDSESK